MQRRETEAAFIVVRILHFAFPGHFERDERYVYAVCDHAPLVTSGHGEDEALARMKDSIRLYLGLLAERKEVPAAIEAGLVNVELRRPPTDLSAASIKRAKKGFAIHLSSVA